MNIIGGAEQQCDCGLSIAAGTPHFLVIAVDGFGQTSMNNRANFRLIHAQAERGGRHDNVDAARPPVSQQLFTFRIGKVAAADQLDSTKSVTLQRVMPVFGVPA